MSCTSKDGNFIKTQLNWKSIHPGGEPTQQLRYNVSYWNAMSPWYSLVSTKQKYVDLKLNENTVYNIMVSFTMNIVLISMVIILIQLIQFLKIFEESS